MHDIYTGHRSASRRVALLAAADVDAQLEGQALGALIEAAGEAVELAGAAEAHAPLRGVGDRALDPVSPRDPGPGLDLALEGGQALGRSARRFFQAIGIGNPASDGTDQVCGEPMPTQVAKRLALNPGCLEGFVCSLGEL